MKQIAVEFTDFDQNWGYFGRNEH